MTPARGKVAGAYAHSALIKTDATKAGFDEALVLDQNGHISEGSAMNVFMLRDGVLVTPPVTDNILEGITRNCVMELARNEMGLEVVERSIGRSELYIADEVFFTGTAVEVAPIVQIDHRLVGTGETGPVTAKLRSLYMEATRGRMPAYYRWLWPVYRSVAAGKAA